ncbi:MAG: hypothetical protein ACRCTY_07610, partial [Candidatus Adiutrix sp.]
VAVVMEINQTALHEPLVKIIADQSGMLYSRPKLYDLNSETDGTTIKRIITKSEAGFDPAYYFKLSE